MHNIVEQMNLERENIVRRRTRKQPDSTACKFLEGGTESSNGGMPEPDNDGLEKGEMKRERRRVGDR